MPQSSSSSPKRRAYARIAASTASTCLRSDGDSVHSQKRDQASGRESSKDMVGTLAQLPGRPDARSARAPEPLMEKFVIEGGVPLSGTVVPAGNKNAALPLLAACLLTAEPVVLHNVPQIRDTEALLVLLEALGVKVERSDGNTLRLQADAIRTTEVDADLAERIRASVLVGGPLLARFGSALQACDFFMDEPSVMGTENALMAAALTPGSTIIRNAASEPHVQDLARMLTRMGAAIEGIGSNVMHVHGIDKLGGCEHAVSPDHIEIGSFMSLAGVTGGELRIAGIVPDDLRMIRLAFSRLGLRSEL